jgi:cell division septation protein DedD
MIRDFSREELEPVASNDTELTLGLGTVLGLGGGLVVLCAICFVAGYAVGHRASANENAATVLPSLNSGASPIPRGNKPGAVRQAEGSSPTSAAADFAGETPSATRSGAEAAADGAELQQNASSATERSVRPALQGPTAGQPAQPVHVQPATSQVQGWMVQIAAVSRTEDADVLVGALRKRGYAVNARRELGDNLIHVQTGPFTNRNDANEMRQKLLNDGYNAMVQ